MENKTEPKSLHKPFENIALCISGGGFRASGYGLGVLSYLHELKTTENKSLLEQVSYLSTTSGGSLLAALYMKSLTDGDTFDVFFRKATDFMDGEELLQKALQKLSDKNEWSQKTKSRNLINSFAKVYDDYLSQQTFSEYWEKRANCHIKENCYNATEFNTGITFRFKTKPSYGNKYVRLTEDAIKQLKVADIIAASSCFPVGFEPLIYPNDFSKNETQLKELSKGLTITDPYNRIVTPPFALMDGGITDNQGIESMMLANVNKSEEEKFSLAIIADVSNKFMSPWRPPNQTNQDDTDSISMYLKALKLMPWFLVGSILLLCFNFTEKLGILFLLISMTGTYLNFRRIGILKSIKKIFDTDDNINWDRVMSKYLNYFGSLPLSGLTYLLKVRLTSLAMLSYDIFLKQVRRMRYNELYANEQWENRRVSTLIYELTEPNNPVLQREILDKIEKIIGNPKAGNNKQIINDKFNEIWKILSPSAKLMHIADYASTMGTTLWFDKNDISNDRLNKIIATGQFTTCFNLLEYLLLLQLKYPQDFNYQEILNQLMSDWKKFKDNPEWLIK